MFFPDRTIVAHDACQTRIVVVGVSARSWMYLDVRPALALSGNEEAARRERARRRRAGEMCKSRRRYRLIHKKDGWRGFTSGEARRCRVEAETGANIRGVRLTVEEEEKKRYGRL